MFNPDANHLSIPRICFMQLGRSLAAVEAYLHSATNGRCPTMSKEEFSGPRAAFEWGCRALQLGKQKTFRLVSTELAPLVVEFGEAVILGQDSFLFCLI